MPTRGGPTPRQVQNLIAQINLKLGKNEPLTVSDRDVLSRILFRLSTRPKAIEAMFDGKPGVKTLKPVAMAVHCLLEERALTLDGCAKGTETTAARIVVGKQWNKSPRTVANAVALHRQLAERIVDDTVPGLAAHATESGADLAACIRKFCVDLVNTEPLATAHANATAIDVIAEGVVRK
jgi:hypothetical protein